MDNNFYQGYQGEYMSPLRDHLGQLRAQQYQPQRMPGNGQPPQGQQPRQPQQPIIWVQGLEGAKAFFVVPNSTVQLWDAERQTIYLKSADPAGIPSIRILDYVERIMPTGPAQQNTGEYLTRAEFEEFKLFFNSLISPPAKGKRTNKEEGIDNG